MTTLITAAKETRPDVVFVSYDDHFLHVSFAPYQSLLILINSPWVDLPRIDNVDNGLRFFYLRRI